MPSWIGRFLSSSVGKKTVMALTGLSLVGFLVVHLLGNFTLYTEKVLLSQIISDPTIRKLSLENTPKITVKVDRGWHENSN